MHFYVAYIQHTTLLIYMDQKTHYTQKNDLLLLIYVPKI